MGIAAAGDSAYDGLRWGVGMVARYLICPNAHLIYAAATLAP